MTPKGIAIKPMAKRINKLPLIIFISALFIIVAACFYVVTQRQNKLQQVKLSGPVMETAPINADTQTPDFLRNAFVKELEEKEKLQAKRLIKDQSGQSKDSGQAPELESKNDPGTGEKKPQDPGEIRKVLDKPFQPYYQAQNTSTEPQKSEAQLFREKVASQKREAALKALQAPTLVSIGNTSSKLEQTIPSAFPTNSQYRPPPVAMPQNEPPDQAQKKDFLNSAEQQQVSLANAYHKAGSPFELKQGHLIPMTLITKINSDLPGRIKAQVTENVYDTATGNYLLIPQGTMVNGVYDSRVVFGQKRVLIAWQRLIFPDGSALNVGTMPGTDREGAAGLNDLVENHYFQIFGSAILMSIVNAGFTLVTDTSDTASDKETAQDSLAKSAATQLQQTFSRILDKIMSIQPELIIRQGKQGHIILTKDVVGLKPYDPAEKPTYFLNTAQVR